MYRTSGRHITGCVTKLEHPKWKARPNPIHVHRRPNIHFPGDRCQAKRLTRNQPDKRARRDVEGVKGEWKESKCWRLSPALAVAACMMYWGASVFDNEVTPVNELPKTPPFSMRRLITIS